MDSVRKPCNQFSPFHLKNLKRDRRQEKEMIARKKPSIFENGDDDDCGFARRRKDSNNNIENKYNARTENMKIITPKSEHPKQNKVAIDKTESSSRNEKTNKIPEVRCKSIPLKTPEKEDHSRPTGKTKSMNEDVPAKRRKLYDNATGLLNEVEEALKHLREEKSVGDKEMRTKGESRTEVVQGELNETSGASFLESPNKTSNSEAICSDESSGLCSDVGSKRHEQSTAVKRKDENVTKNAESEALEKNTKQTSDEQTEKTQGKSIDDEVTDMVVVRSPTELAEVTDPFELQRMGYEFMVAATSRLQEEKFTANDKIKEHLSTIDKLKTDLNTEERRALMLNNIYDHQVKRLKQMNEKLEETSKIQKESMEKLEQKIKETNEEKEKEVSTLKESLENKIQTLLEENEKLTNEAIKSNELIKAQKVKIGAIPGAVQFFLRKFLEEGIWSKIKEERKNSNDGESEKKVDEKEDEVDNIFDKMSA